MYCQNCGHSLGADARFCPTCGRPAPNSNQPASLKPSATVPSLPVAETAQPQEISDELAPMSFAHVLFSVDGRIGRIKFIAGWVALLALYVFALLLSALVAPNARADTVLTLLTFVFLWPNFALWVKRVHDCNYAALVLLLLFIPLLGLAVVILAFFVRGTKGPNNYGQAANVSPLAAIENTGEWQ